MITLSKNAWHVKFLQNFPFAPMRIYNPTAMQFCPYMRSLLGRMAILLVMLPFPISLIYEFFIGWHDVSPSANSLLQNFRFCASVVTLAFLFGLALVHFIIPGMVKFSKATSRSVSNARASVFGNRPEPAKKKTKKELIWEEADRRFYAALDVWNKEVLSMKEGDSYPIAPDWAQIHQQVEEESRSGFAKMMIAFSESIRKGLCPNVNWAD